MPDDKLKYDALIESKSWDTLTEEEVAELASAGIGREEYEIIRSTLKGLGGLSDPDERITMRPEARVRLMDMFDAENQAAAEEADPRIIRIRQIRRLYFAVAAAAAVILVSSLWWFTLRDDGTEPLIPVTEIAEHKPEQPDVTLKDADISSSESPFKPLRGEQGGESATVHEDAGNTEITYPATVAQVDDTFKSPADDTRMIADLFNYSGNESEIVVKDLKTKDLSSKKVTVEAYSEPAGTMQVRSDFRVTKQGTSGKGESTRAASRTPSSRPANNDTELLKFLYACR